MNKCINTSKNKSFINSSLNRRSFSFTNNFQYHLFTNCFLSPQSKVSSMTDDQRSYLTLEERVKGGNKLELYYVRLLQL